MSQGEKLCMIREMYEAGSSFEAIAEATGYKVNSVKQLLPKAGIKRYRKIADYEKEIVQMRKDGMKLDEISKKIGFSVSLISTYLCKIGCNKNRTWETEEEPEQIDESNLVYAEDRKVKREVVFWQGRRFINVIDAVVGS